MNQLLWSFIEVKTNKKPHVLAAHKVLEIHIIKLVNKSICDFSKNIKWKQGGS